MFFEKKIDRQAFYIKILVEQGFSSPIDQYELAEKQLGEQG